MKKYMIEDIAKECEKKYGVKPDIDYDYHPLHAEDVIELIQTHLECEELPTVSTGEGTVSKSGDDMVVTLLTRGVELTFWGFYKHYSSNQSKIGEN